MQGLISIRTPWTSPAPMPLKVQKVLATTWSRLAKHESPFRSARRLNKSGAEVVVMQTQFAAKPSQHQRRELNWNGNPSQQPVSRWRTPIPGPTWMVSQLTIFFRSHWRFSPWIISACSHRWTDRWSTTSCAVQRSTTASRCRSAWSSTDQLFPRSCNLFQSITIKGWTLLSGLVGSADDNFSNFFDGINISMESTAKVVTLLRRSLRSVSSSPQRCVFWIIFSSNFLALFFHLDGCSNLIEIETDFNAQHVFQILLSRQDYQFQWSLPGISPWYQPVIYTVTSVRSSLFWWLWGSFWRFCFRDQC